MAQLGESVETIEELQSGGQAIRRILVVDDNHVNQLVATKMLEALGYACETVDSGQECMAALSQEDYTLVFMDVEMPGLTGPEVTEQIRAKKGRNSAVPIIGLTAATSAADNRRCLNSGMNTVVTKPFRREDIAKVLARYLPRGASQEDKAR